jgi:hypothetical protein
MNNDAIVYVRGKTSFAKILGNPVDNYAKDGKEWKMDLVISDETAKEMKQYGISDRVKIKDGYVDGQKYLSFKQPEYRKGGDGTPVRNQPIKVVDIKGETWPDDKLIGNGSDVDVKFRVVDYGKGKKPGVYISSVRVLKLVSYTKKEDFPEITEDDPFYVGVDNTENALDGLNDEIPF